MAVIGPVFKVLVTMIGPVFKVLVAVIGPVLSACDLHAEKRFQAVV